MGHHPDGAKTNYVVMFVDKNSVYAIEGSRKAGNVDSIRVRMLSLHEPTLASFQPTVQKSTSVLIDVVLPLQRLKCR